MTLCICYLHCGTENIYLSVDKQVAQQEAIFEADVNASLQLSRLKMQAVRYWKERESNSSHYSCSGSIHKSFSVLLTRILSFAVREPERCWSANSLRAGELGSKNLREPVPLQTDANVKRTVAPLIVHYFVYLDQIFNKIILMCVSWGQMELPFYKTYSWP